MKTQFQLKKNIVHTHSFKIHSLSVAIKRMATVNLNTKACLVIKSLQDNFCNRTTICNINKRSPEKPNQLQ